MSLIRCTRLLSGKSATISNVYKHSCVYYSSDKKPSDGDVEQDGKQKDAKKADEKPSDAGVKQANKSEQNQPKSIKSDSLNRLNSLLSKMSSKSSLKIVNEVKLSKPLGYSKLRENQQIDRKPKNPRNLRNAAKAVSAEFGDENVEHEILSQIPHEGTDDQFLDDVISKMKNPQKNRPKVGSFKIDGTDSMKGNRRPIPFNAPRGQTISGPVQSPFTGKPLGIFTSADNLKTIEDPLKTWRKLEQYELYTAMSSAPRNYFEKMAYWTEEGKIWNFPIDNEQGLDEERETPFTEHVFLEEHLEPWCPKKGAVRNFMELVCIGLSKNPFYTVQQKREHIEWYRNYFEEKKDILQRVIETNRKYTATQVTDGAKST